MRAFFVAATGQNVGKTTTSLGLVAAFQKKYGSIGFQKPVGQEHVDINGARVDKDVALFKERFSLKDSLSDMSPVLFPKGFTRDYLDGKVNIHELKERIQISFQKISSSHKMTVVEGTGHTGVGSIVDLNNAQVAALLKIPVLLVCSGGLGSSFDELALNIIQCKHYGANIAGVIVNRVLDDKREMILNYFPKALQRFNIPLLGALPFDALLSEPTMQDFEALFHTKLIAGKEHHLRHFENLSPEHLLIRPATQEGVVTASGLILTGRTPPSPAFIKRLLEKEIPTLHVPLPGFVVMKMINTFTAKIRSEDTAKINEAIELTERHIDLDKLEKALAH